MSQGRELFALEWVKSEIDETLDDARGALEAYAEQGKDETRMRVCLTKMHQVHGTLVMLELPGVALLADYLERLAQGLLEYETLTGDEIKRVMNGEPPNADDDDDTASDSGGGASITAIPSAGKQKPAPDADPDMEPEPQV